MAAKEINRIHTTSKTVRIYIDPRQSILIFRNHKIMTISAWVCHKVCRDMSIVMTIKTLTS